MNIERLFNKLLTAGLVVLIVSGTIGSIAAVADETVATYAAPVPAHQAGAGPVMDEAISGAAERANAALTEALRMTLEERVRGKLPLTPDGIVSQG